jgi:hypothetical protein
VEQRAAARAARVDARTQRLQLGGGEQDEAQALRHDGGKLCVVLGGQDGRERAVHGLGVHQLRQLPDDQRAARLQQLAVRRQQLGQRRHEPRKERRVRARQRRKQTQVHAHNLRRLHPRVIRK